MHQPLQKYAPVAVGVAIVGAFTLGAGTFSHQSFAAAPATAADLFSGGASDQARITAAVKRDEPSVVAIDVTVGGTRYVPTDMFGDMAPRSMEGRASGSGFVYQSDGTIVTNAHVVAPPTGGNVEKIDVVFANGDHVPGHVIAMNRGADLALVKVDRYAKLPPALPLGNARALEAGQWAIAIGEPLELRQTVTVGVVSGFDRSEPISDDDGGSHTFSGLLQTSAPINPGNSGGPLIDMDGRVIGINQSVAGGAQGIGFAIPVDTIKTDVTAMLANPHVADTTTGATGNGNAFVGVQLAPLDAVRSQLDYIGDGVAVAAVSPGSPAQSAGLKPGDVIRQINGRAVDTPKDAADAIHALKPGQTANMQLWSQGAQKTVAVQTTSAPQVGMVPQQRQQQQMQQPSAGGGDNGSDDGSNDDGSGSGNDDGSGAGD